MTALLTSTFGGWTRKDGAIVPAELVCGNGLLEQLLLRWTPEAKILFIAADPKDYAKNDGLSRGYSYALREKGLSVSTITVLDDRNRTEIQSLKQYHSIILSGGHVPTQNAFFADLGLKSKIADYPGIVIGISAGSMNSAETVYAHPELEGEAADPGFRRFLPGLGLTKRMVIPHYEIIKNFYLDGLRVIEEIACPDSDGKEFYALNNGSYILCEDGRETLYGESYRIRDGSILKICGDGESRPL